MNSSESQQNLLNNEQRATSSASLSPPTEYILGPVEKHFLLSAERGDCATVRRLLDENKDHPEILNIDCVDPLNRSALIAAIENENIDLIYLLIEMGISIKDALLHAIKEEYVEAVEVLLEHEEKTHKPGQPYSWEAVDRSASNFTPDITPLVLAAHMNNYEILKILLDRGATLPTPHDVRCGCDECVTSTLSSRDPLLTAFELSWELRRLSRMEQEFRQEYNEMRESVQVFATSLLDHARTSYELEIMLNFNPTGEAWEPGERQTLERLKLAIKYKQKQFVAHPNVQQLLAKIWYDGLPGFRRLSMIGQLIEVGKLGAQFPVYSTIYMLSPNSPKALFMKKPFVKFICHSSSYLVFLMLLGAASQRIEYLAIELFGTEWMREILAGWKRRERGCLPGLVESGVVIYVISIVIGEVRSLWSGGLLEYISDLWNIVDFIQNVFYVIWLCMRATSWFVVMREYWSGEDPWYPRDHWSDFEPMLLSEGAFGAAMIFSFLKLVHIFSVNPHLGPLQISLGRMIIDIIKFFFIYTLVLFAFGCGMNQLLWYYADLEKNKCYHLPSGLPDFDNNEKACSTWRRFANLFETSQSLFWASFGMVDLMSFDLTGIKSFTRFWALLMFGSYSVINIIVLLNMLIAMMSNSYQIISERADTEWKFARSHLWMSYFEDGDTVPPPFNMIPTAKTFDRIIKCGKSGRPTRSIIKKSREKSQERHDTVMRLLIRRYVTTEQSKTDDYGITEDDVMEIRQDISTLRYELIDILRQNGMKTPEVDKGDSSLSGKKGRVMERRLQKDFQIGPIEGIISSVIQSEKAPKDVFSQIAKAIGRKSSETKKKDWNAVVRQNTTARDPIGSSTDALEKQHRRSLRRHLQRQGNSALESLDPQRLVEYNPALSEVSATTRIAYAKFMLRRPVKDEAEDGVEVDKSGSRRGSQRVKIAEPPKPGAAAAEGAPTAAGSSVDKPSMALRALSTTSKKSLIKAASLEKSAAIPSGNKASLEAKPSLEARGTPSPIPEDPREGSDVAKTTSTTTTTPAAPPRQPSVSIKKQASKSEEKKSTDATPKPKPTAAPSFTAPPDPVPTTQARGKSKATGQIVGGWI